MWSDAGTPDVEKGLTSAVPRKEFGVPSQCATTAVKVCFAQDDAWNFGYLLGYL